MHPYFALDLPLVIGHRGSAGTAPENTLASFERALADGAVLLESDVHVTRDGVPVLIHDDRVDRCTNGHGAVHEFDLADLQALDAGHHFAPADAPDAGHPERGRGHRIPTLEEALDAFPTARFNLELKLDRPGLVENTAAVVARAKRAETTLLTSGDDGIMARLREHVAAEGVSVALGACTGEAAAFAMAAARGETPPAGPMALQIPDSFAGQPLVTPVLVEAAHRHGVQIHVWTINDPDAMHALFDLGVDGIVSDFPGRLAGVVTERRTA